MNLNKLVVGISLTLAAAVAVGLLVGIAGFWVVVGMLLLVLLTLFLDHFVYVRVGEMEAAIVFNRETRAFSRFLLPGRHMLKFPLERVMATVSTAPTIANGRCKNAQTQEGVGVDLEFSVTYEVFLDETEPTLRPRMARFLPSGANGLVRNHTANCVARVVNNKTIESLCQKGVRSRLEHELGETVKERLRPFGISVYRVMVLNVELPVQVKAALEEAHDRRVYAESEACALERLHNALSQFSDADVERLLHLRQLRELGQNGVTMHMPYMGGAGFRGTGGDGTKENGRSRDDLPFDMKNGKTKGRPYS